MSLSTVSLNGVGFSGRHEGFVSRAYKDAGGVWTIGHGFTNGSVVFRTYWLKTRGHALREGDKITLEESLRLLSIVINQEYAPAAARDIQPQTQHEMDGATDVAYNAGVGSLRWQWGKALRARDVAGACKLLLTTAITAAGKPLNGLRRRRADEARLIQHGDYGDGNSTPAVSTSVEDVKAYQTSLQTLGYYAGDIDGDATDEMTIGAVKNFQRAFGLKVDGVVGPATRSALARAIDAKTRGNVSLTTGVGSGLGGGVINDLGIHLDNPWVIVAIGVGVVIVVYLAFLLWHNRGALTGVRTHS